MTERPRRIRRDPDPPPALDFAALVRTAVARAQAVSGKVWTDYNAHDPGVTMLEQAAFALVDVGYRAGHPVADLVATAAAEPDGEMDPAKTFPPPQAALSTAPVTADDLRVLICERVPEVRAVWIRPEDDADAARFSPDGTPAPRLQVFIHLFRETDGRPADASTTARVIAAVEGELHGNRPLGAAFRPVRTLEAAEITLTAELDLAPGHNADDVTAELLHRVDVVLCPPLTYVSRAKRLAEAPTDAVYEGPPVVHGVADLPPQPPLTRPSEAAIRAAAAATPGVRRIGRFAVDWGDAAAPCAFTVKLGATAYDAIAVRRDDRLAETKLGVFGTSTLGAPQGETPRCAHITTAVTHKMARLRQSRLRCAMEEAAAAAAAAPSGQRRPGLGRYRSIQHDFPEFFELAPGSESAAPAPGGGGEAETPQERRARILALRTFLTLMEQPIADMLQQLRHAPHLLSVEGGDGRTYVNGDLTPRGDCDADAPPSFMAGLTNPASYAAAVRASAQRADPDGLRREAILDHLLARFDEGVDGWRLAQFVSAAPQAARHAAETRIADKRAFLTDIVQLGARRGLAAGDGTPAALATRLSLKTGLTEYPVLIEHALLDGLGSTPADPALLCFAGRWWSAGVPDIAVHGTQVAWSVDGAARYGTLYADAPWDGQDMLDAQIRIALGRATASLLDVDADRFRCALIDDDAPSTPSLVLAQHFAAFDEARTALRSLLALGDSGTFRPVLFPAPFFADRLTIVIDGGLLPDSPEYRRFVETVAKAEAPAHLETAVVWRDDLAACASVGGLTEIGALRKAVAAARAGDGTAARALARTVGALAFARELAELQAASP